MYDSIRLYYFICKVFENRYINEGQRSKVKEGLSVDSNSQQILKREEEKDLIEFNTQEFQGIEYFELMRQERGMFLGVVRYKIGQVEQFLFLKLSGKF